MEQLVMLKNETLLRTSVITNRIDNDFIAIAKAMMIDELKTKMRNGIAHFVFRKIDGSLRECWGTTLNSLVKNKVSGYGNSRETYNTTAFFDVEVGAWRSFRWESLIKVY